MSVVFVSVFYPIYLFVGIFPRSACAFWGCIGSFLGLLVSGVILLFRHRTFLGLIPIILAVCLFLGSFAILESQH